MQHQIVSREEWLASRKAFLAKEKAFTRARDQLSAERRELPWVKLDKTYAFDTPEGKKSLADLFAGRSQLIVYHFMLGPDWIEGCPSCSYLADHFDGMLPHLAERDVSFTAISRAPLAEIEAYKRRMGWRFPWASSSGNDFNFDFGVSFPLEDGHGSGIYNFERQDLTSDEMPGVSAFYKDESGAVFHTYSCYNRGNDQLNVHYHYLDLVPKGRDEAGRGPYWVRRHDEYDR